VLCCTDTRPGTWTAVLRVLTPDVEHGMRSGKRASDATRPVAQSWRRRGLRGEQARRFRGIGLRSRAIASTRGRWWFNSDRRGFERRGGRWSAAGLLRRLSLGVRHGAHGVEPTGWRGGRGPAWHHRHPQRRISQAVSAKQRLPWRATVWRVSGRTVPGKDARIHRI